MSVTQTWLARTTVNCRCTRLGQPLKVCSGYDVALYSPRTALIPVQLHNTAHPVLLPQVSPIFVQVAMNPPVTVYASLKWLGVTDKRQQNADYLYHVPKPGYAATRRTRPGRHPVPDTLSSHPPYSAVLIDFKAVDFSVGAPLQSTARAFFRISRSSSVGGGGGGAGFSCASVVSGSRFWLPVNPGHAARCYPVW